MTALIASADTKIGSLSADVLTDAQHPYENIAGIVSQGIHVEHIEWWRRLNTRFILAFNDDFKLIRLFPDVQGTLSQCNSLFGNRVVEALDVGVVSVLTTGPETTKVKPGKKASVLKVQCHTFGHFSIDDNIATGAI